MEVINRKHKAISPKPRVSPDPYVRIEGGKALYFSAAAGKHFGMVEGLYVHFHNDGDRWYFYCDNDVDGFKLCPRNAGDSGVSDNATLIRDRSLVSLIIKRRGCSIGGKYPIAETGSKHKGNPLLEILFNKPI